MRNIKIGNKKIGNDEPTFIIAEAGINHNGNEKIAFEMVKEAKRIGVDAIKFQTFITEETVSRNAPFAEHHVANVKDAESHFSLIKKVELPLDVFAKLKVYAQNLGLIFISTPYDIISAKYLISIGVPAIKIASAEIENAPLVDEIIKGKVPIILSTGMNSFSVVAKVVKKILKNDGDLAILKCTSNYPVDYGNVNLLGIETLKDKFKDCMIGFSDHSEGFEVACAAVVLGAKIIEKHFTLDKKMWGPDHKASLDVIEFKAVVKAIRNVERARGSRDIRVLESEKSQKKTMQKSIYSRNFIPKGKKILLDDLMFLRPSGGISPAEYKKIIGKTCKVDIKKGVLIKKEYFVKKSHGAEE